VVSAQFTQAAAEDNVRLIKGQFLPTLDLQASISRAKENTGQSGLRTDNGQVLAQLTVPLYQGGAVSADMRQAEEVVGIRKGQVDDARRAAVQAADQAFEQRDAARDLVELLGDQIRVNEVALEGIKREAAAGDRTVYDILVQEETLFQSEESLVQAQHDQRVAEFTLAQATGRLTAKSLGLPVVYYDPDRYFEAVRVPDGPIDGVFGPDDPPPQ
jgi:outer membrane protein